MRTVDLTQLKVYAKNGFQLIPLYKWNKRTRLKTGVIRDDGKRPCDSNWTKKPYSNADVLKLAEKGFNCGVRLTPDVLVIDVDPRHFPPGKDSFAAFCKATKFRYDDNPYVLTGGGGLHIYTKKDPNVAVVDSLEGYEGIEFKTVGRQVVAAGAIHPSGKSYEWAFKEKNVFAPGLEAIKAVPETIMNLIKRPAFVDREVGTGGGEYDQEEIAKMLAALDPEEFREHDDWFTLMRSCHHASGGDARQEFIDWSTQDPSYKDEAAVIGRRWDSLHLKKPDGRVTTYRTLHKILEDHGEMKAIVRKSAQEDFDDLEMEPSSSKKDDLVPEYEQKNPLEWLNAKHAYVLMDGKGYISRLSENVDPDSAIKENYSFLKLKDFEEYYANKRIETTNAKGEAIAVPVAKEWMAWKHRNTKEGVIFDPEREHKNFINLWRGWNIVPKPGDWSLMQELMEVVLCDGDKDAYEFLLNWIAYMWQHPGSPAEVAICFYGDKGTGKSTLGRLLKYIAGQHGKIVVSSESLTGRFNGHLRDGIFVFSDEAISPNDKAAIAMLQAMITETTLSFESKGKDILCGQRNMMHLMLASNLDKFVPASLVNGERRYFVCHVNNKRQKDTDFFGRLKKQMYEEGGAEAMFHDLKVRDLGNWAPRGNIPKTAGLLDQQMRNMKPEEEFWVKALLDKGFMNVDYCIPSGMNHTDWDEGPIEIFIEDFRSAFAEYCKQKGLREGANNRMLDFQFFKTFKRLCPGFDSRKKRKVEDRLDLKTFSSLKNWAQCIRLPSISDCKKQFEKQTEQSGLFEKLEKDESREEDTMGTESTEKDPFRLEE